MEELLEIEGLEFETITFSQATQVAGQGVAKIAPLAFRYYLGDHWGPNGEGWMGPRPPENEADSVELMAQIRRAFVSKNTVKEVVARHRSGVLGKEPSWGFTVTRALARDEEPTQEEQALIDEMEAALTEWWDEREAHRLLQVAIEALLCAGKSTLRLFIPPGKLRDGQLPEGLTLAQALNLIFLGVPRPEQAGTYTDPDLMEDIGVYTYTRKGIGRAEVSYLDFPESPTAPPVTILRTLSVQTDQQSGARSPQGSQATRQPQIEETPAPGFVDVVELDLNGHILIYEMNRDTLITPQVLQNQDLLNMALTMLGRNAVQGGFLERIFLNAEEPSETTTEYNSVTGQNDDVEVAQPLQVGPGRSTFVQGRTYKDEVSGISLEEDGIVIDIGGDEGERLHQVVIAYIFGDEPVKGFKVPLDQLLFGVCPLQLITHPEEPPDHPRPLKDGIARLLVNPPLYQLGNPGISVRVAGATDVPPNPGHGAVTREHIKEHLL